jgi:hypothetical protein
VSVVGFIVTPGEIQNRIAALDTAIVALDRSISANKSPRLNAPWRAEWHAFLSRWGVERDSYATWDSRLFATRVMPRLQAFEESYRWWFRDYERRVGTAAALPNAAPSSGLMPSTNTLLWAGAAVLALFLLTQRGPRG